MNDLAFATAGEVAAAIHTGAVSSVEVLEESLTRIGRYNSKLNAIVTLDEDGARRRALDADAALRRGEIWGPLHGIPITLKDSHSTAGMRTTAGFPPLANYVPREDGTVAARLKAAGAIILGKTNVPTLLTQPQTDNPIFGRTNNPWNLERTPGGSSGGAAAAVSAGLIPLDIGSDFGGSIRMPAHFCGVFGFKPTARRVSMFGHIPDLPGKPRFDRVLSSCGPLARSVDDLILAFRLIVGPDGRDTEVPPVPIKEVSTPEMRELRIAWSPTFSGTPIAGDIREAIESFATALQQSGASVEEALPEISFEAQHLLWARYYKMLSFLITNVYGADPPGRTVATEPPTMVEMMDVAEKRDEFIVAWDRFLDKWDVLLCPASMVTAFPHCPPGTPIHVDSETAKYGQVNHHCFPFNITGNPAVVIPIGRDREGLPIGVQVVGPRWRDERLLAIAKRISEVAGPIQHPPGY